MMFSSSPKTVSLIQYSTVLASIAGLFVINFTYANLLTLFIFYFLYAGVGVSMMMHRYFTHKSFEFASPLLKYICIWFAVTAGRGSPLGWVYVHRLHHSSSDLLDDPHYSSLNYKTMWFPSYNKFIDKFNFRIIKDLLNKENIFIDRYYLVFVLFWISALAFVSLEFLYFAWILPVVLTHFAFNTFLYVGHTHGYRNFEINDNSKNSWLYALLLWGEGWHNNHHKNPGSYNLQVKWWEIDIVGSVIRFIKK